MPESKHFPQYSSAQKASISISSGTTTAVIAGVANQTIRILFIVLVGASGANTFQFADGTTPGAFTGAMPIGLGSGAPQGIVLDHTSNPLIMTAGNSFSIITTQSIGLTGYVMFTQGQD